MELPSDGPVLESMPVGFIGLDDEWRVTYINAAGEAVVGKTREELVGSSYWDAFPANGDNEFGRTYREVVATGEPQTVEAFYPEPLNRWFEMQAVPGTSGLSLYFMETTERRRAQERLAMLARVSAELTGTLDMATAARRIPRLLSPALGDGCLITVVDEDGRPRDAGFWHADPVKRPVMERYSAAWLAAVPAGAPVVRSLLGDVVVAPGPAVLDVLPEGEARELFGILAPQSTLTVPLVGRGRVVGALSLYFDGREVTEDDVVAAREIAERVGLALDNSRVFDQHRQVTEELQRSLLSEPLEPDHAEIVVRYIPAAEAVRVGGDWYDAFVQPSGSPMLVIGDVVGHDTAAAVAMGQLRALLRGIAAYSDEGPAEVLRGLDGVMDRLQVGTYATAAVARFEQTAEESERGVTRMRWSNAGHLPPLVVHADGSLAALADWRGDLLLGVDSTTERHESVVTLDRRSTVLLFTDGLIERRDGDLDDGMARLRSAAAELADRSLDQLCDELVQRLVQGRPEDDVALVAIRLRDPGAPQA